MINYKFLTSAIVAVFTFLSCQKQTVIKNINIDVTPNRSEEYYANLRAYKESDHQICFGWFAGINGSGDSTKISVLDHIPDSVDLVSCWGGYPPKGSYNHLLLKKIRKEKGTKFVKVSFDDQKFLDRYSDTSFVDVYDKGDSMLTIGFDLIGRNIKAELGDMELDGIDLDHEPNICGCDWGLLKDDRKYNIFLQALSKYLGPLSGTDKLFIVDGEYSMIASETAKGLSYIITQAYSTSNPSSLQNRFDSAPEGFPPHKFIVTENFESFWSTGGVDYQHPVHGIIPSLLGMAYWQPNQGRKGGAGSFHTEYEYALTPDYKYTRQAIQIMNPAAN